MEFTIKEVPFSWNDNFSEIALEDFSMTQKNLSYGICQSIGMALAKLKLLEEQGCKVEEQYQNLGFIKRKEKNYVSELL